MTLRSDCEIAAALQAQLNHLCNVDIFLPPLYMRAQIDLLFVLATLFDVEIALPEKRWRIQEPAAIEADYANNQT